MFSRPPPFEGGTSYGHGKAYGITFNINYANIVKYLRINSGEERVRNRTSSLSILPILYRYCYCQISSNISREERVRNRTTLRQYCQTSSNIFQHFQGGKSQEQDNEWRRICYYYANIVKHLGILSGRKELGSGHTHYADAGKYRRISLDTCRGEKSARAGRRLWQ